MFCINSVLFRIDPGVFIVSFYCVSNDDKIHIYRKLLEFRC